MKTIITLIIAAALTACGGGGSDATPAPVAAPVVPTVPAKPIPTVAITFDYYGSTYTNAYPMLRDRGLQATFFVDPDTVDNGQATTAQLNEMRSNGWSIQGYTGVNMVNLLAASGPNAVVGRLNGMKATMSAKGFDITAIAPASRAWNQQLRDLTQGIFTSVRANIDTTAWQSYPIADPLYVTKGATPSLSSTDTSTSMRAQLDSLEAGSGLWVIVVHKVGDDADPAFSIKSAELKGFLDRLAADAKAGKVRVAKFENAIYQ